MKKIVSLIFAGTLIFGSANAQILNEQNVTLNMDIQPVLQLMLEGPTQHEFVFDDIKDYYAGIVKYGANILKVSASVKFDLWAAGLSQQTNRVWDPIYDYAGGAAATGATNVMPLTALELRQFPPNPMIADAVANVSAACGGGGAGGIFSSGLGSGGAVIGRLAMAGSIVKGPVANALIFQDIDGDGYTEGVDPFAFTDADGNYDMRFFPGSGQIVVLDEYYVDSANRPVSMNILGEPTGEQFQSDPDRFTLKKAIDLTTGSQPGSFTFDAPDGEVSDGEISDG